MADERKEEDYIEIKIPSQEQQPQEVTASAAQESAPKDEPARAEPAKPRDNPAPKKKTSKKRTAKRKTAKKKTSKKKAAAPITPKRKPKKKDRSPPSSNWLWILLLAIGLLVIGAVIYLSLQEQPAPAQGEEDQVAAIVNDQPIYQAEVDRIHENLPATMGTIDKEVILEQLIEQELMVQEARDQGITITDEELQDYIDELLAYFGVPKDQFDAALEAQDMTRAEFERSSERQLLVNKLANKTVYSQIEITPEEIAAYYEEHQEEFRVPATATVRHILITPLENETDEETQQRAQDVLAQLGPENEEFCALVKNHTADVASVATCGEYDVQQNGRFDPDFEQAAFDMDVGETRIVHSDFGYHVMWKTNHTEAGILPLEQASARIQSTLFQEQASEELAQYMASLRDEAVIEKYPDTEEESAPPLDVEGEGLEAEVEKTRPVREGDFGECLAEQEAVLYGVSWAPDVEEQKEMLGAAAEEISYVDCDPAEGEAPAACADINVYPTWVIGSGEDALVLPGKQSVNALARQTGCQA